jgi:hypothetical protein
LLARQVVPDDGFLKTRGECQSANTCKKNLARKTGQKNLPRKILPKKVPVVIGAEIRHSVGSVVMPYAVTLNTVLPTSASQVVKGRR